VEREMTNEIQPGKNRDDIDDEAHDFETYDANHLLDSVLDRLQLENDTALCNLLDITPSILSDIRLMRQPIDAAMLVRLHELTDISISGLRNILGDRREKSRYTDSLDANHG
jgi:hypothetical protein